MSNDRIANRCARILKPTLCPPFLCLNQQIAHQRPCAQERKKAAERRPSFPFQAQKEAYDMSLLILAKPTACTLKPRLWFPFAQLKTVLRAA